MKEPVRLVSMLLPTRGRVKKLKESLDSLEATVRCAADIEVLVKVDDDDEETIKYLNESPRRFHVGVVTGPRGNGYADLHLMYNRLCEEARGRFLFLWNDDATMQTNHWDVQLEGHDHDRLCYVKSWLNDGRGRDHFLFPIVHRSYYELLGHFSMSAHNDTYVYSVFSNYPQAFRHTEITIRHHALQFKDQTSDEARQWWPTTKGLWNSKEVQDQLRIDVQKVGELLKQQA